MDLVLPARYRNRNFVRAAVLWLIPVLVLFIPLVAAPLSAKWLFAIPFVATAALTIYYFQAASRVDLVVSEQGLALGGVFRSQKLEWAAIARFEIREPWRRTPFMLTFAWWIDQAKVVLRDGSSVRLRAIEPRHGFTWLTYLTIRDYSEADRIVDALNALLASWSGRDA